MPLTKLSIRRPLTMVMLILGMVIIGARSYNEMKLARFPNVDFPVVSVSVVWPGASPEDIEDKVVTKIEEAVSGIAGIDELTGRAGESYGAVIIQFQDGIDGDAAAVDVQRQVATITDFPDDAEDPQILKFDINSVPIIELVLSGPQSQDVLFDIADNTIKDQLQGVAGVSAVDISGGREREIQVNIDPERLRAYGLTIGEVQRSLAANNITIPAGTLEQGRNKLSVRSVGEFDTLDDIRNVIIAGSLTTDGSSEGLVYLRDIAMVRDGYKDRETFLRYNGREAVNLSIVKSSDANTVELADDVLAQIPQINEKLPAGAKLDVIVDDSEFVRESVEAVQEDLIMAVIITGIIILLFLHTIRNTFIVLMCLPTAIISNFTIMWLFGFTLDGITLLALTLVIGILVDDSIVMVENIERHAVELKEPPKVAAYRGATEIGLAVFSMTLVIVVIYVPVAFISGIIGQFFFSYGITIASSTLFSMFVAFTLTPLLASKLLEDHSKPQPEPKGLRKFFGKLLHYTVGWFWNGFIRLWEYGFTLATKFYAATLRFFLRNFATQMLVIIICTVALGGGIWLVGSGLVGAEFLPAEDEGKIIISLSMPPGTNLDETDRVARQLEQLALQETRPDELVGILTKVGTSEGGAGTSANASNSGQITLVLTDKQQRARGDEEIVNHLRPLTQKIPEATISLQAGEGGGPQGAAIVVRLSGPEKDELIRLANQVEAIVRSVPGTTDIANDDALRSVETQFVVDRERAKDLGLLPQDIASALRTALSGSQVGEFDPPGGTKVDMTVRVQKEDRDNIDQLMQIPVGYNQGQPVLLSQVVVEERDLAPAGITRYNRQLVLDVESGVTGRAVGDVTDDVEAAIGEQMTFPVGYDFQFTGSAEFQREAFSDMLEALGLAIILIYILLVALYQSFLQPLAIMFSLPVTLVGAFGGLYLTDNTLNLISLLGIILLAGVVTKNAILLVDFTNTLRDEEGLNTKDALVEAGRLRLRAIFMTTFSLIFALMPLLLGQGAGSETRAPLAAVVIGGLTSSTFLTLILVPVVYNFFDWTSGLTSRAVNAVWGTEDVPAGSSPQQIPQEEGEPMPEQDPMPEPKPKEERDRKPERDHRPRQPSRPTPQPGSAITFNPQTGSDTA